MRVTSNNPTATGVYELVAAPSPHNNEYESALPQLPELPEDSTEFYPQYAVGAPALYLVYKYSFYNAEKDRARHDTAQVAAKEAAERKGKQFNPTPFKDKGHSRGTWSYLYTEADGRAV